MQASRRSRAGLGLAANVCLHNLKIKKKTSVETEYEYPSVLDVSSLYLQQLEGGLHSLQ